MLSCVRRHAQNETQHVNRHANVGQNAASQYGIAKLISVIMRIGQEQELGFAITGMV